MYTKQLFIKDFSSRNYQNILVEYCLVHKKRTDIPIEFISHIYPEANNTMFEYFCRMFKLSFLYDKTGNLIKIY